MNKFSLVVRTSTNSTSAMIELHVVVVVVDTEKIRRGGSEVCPSGQALNLTSGQNLVPNARILITVDMYTCTYALYTYRQSLRM